MRKEDTENRARQSVINKALAILFFLVVTLKRKYPSEVFSYQATCTRMHDYTRG